MKPHALRLSTSYTWSDPQRLHRLRVGDVVSGALAWTRPVRLGGVQLATDFALRPDLVTQPVQVIAGSVAVPSTVDVLVNGVRQLSQAVEPGRFEVRQPPVVSGAGSVAVVVRDALGRETVQSLPFYNSARLLAPGLAAYALQFGRVRRDHGLPSQRYGDHAGAATLRYGWSDRFTLEAHAEAIEGHVLAAAGGARSLGQLGVVNAGVAASRAAGRFGWLVDAGHAWQSERASFALATTRAGSRYGDIAAAQGEPVWRHTTRASAGASLGRWGTFGAAVVAAARHTDTAPLASSPRTRVLSASWSAALGSRVQLYASLYRDYMVSGAAGGTLTLALPLEGGGGLAGSLARERGGHRAAVQASRAAVATDELGWLLRTEHASAGGAPPRQLAEAEWRATAARLAAGIERFGSSEATRLSAQGALLAVAGQLHASLPVHDSVAVVSTDGLPGVAVYLENRYAGRTDHHGQLVVPGLLSYQTNRLAIDVLDLPLDNEAPIVATEVRPADRSAALVRFSAARRHAALIELRDAGDAPLPLGARVRMRANEQAFVVGHDGQAYLHGVLPDNELTVRWGASSCTARFAWRPDDLDTPGARRVRCE